MQEIVLVTARAHMPRDLRTADDLRKQYRVRGMTTRAWVVHPIEDIDEDRASLLHWLSRHRQVRPTPIMLLSDRVNE